MKPNSTNRTTSHSAPGSSAFQRARLLFSAVFLLGMLVLASPAGVQAADLYVSAYAENNIYKIAPNGTQTVFASVNDPRGLALNSSGDLYVASSNLQKVFKITSAGVQSTFAAGFNTPVSLVLDSAGNVYVADTSPAVYSVFKYTPAGAGSLFARIPGQPSGLAFDGAGNLYIADRTNGAIIKCTPSGAQSTFATGLNLPAGLACDSQGNLYEVDQGTFTVFKFAPNGSRTTFATVDQSTVNQPVRLAVDASDNVYLSATLGTPGNANGSTAIYKFTPAGTQSIFATVNTLASFIAFSPSGPAHPPFFNGEVLLGNGIYYLAFAGTGNPFGYYAYLSDPRFIYHFDLGYEYWYDAQNAQNGVFFYDFASQSFFYTAPSFPFPYLYDFSLQTILYYFPDPNNPGRYNTNGVRYFYNFATGQVIVK